MLDVAALLLHGAMLGSGAGGPLAEQATPASAARASLLPDEVRMEAPWPAAVWVSAAPDRAATASVRWSAQPSRGCAAAGAACGVGGGAPALLRVAMAPGAIAPGGTAQPPASADGPLPRYHTEIPPPALLRYELQHGVLRGAGDLSWRPSGDHYELKLEGRVGTLPVLTQVSVGGFDATGLAPLRFTDQRLRRTSMAANFERSAGKITFSASATELAMRDGVQDRLSWMVQLAAVVAGEPQLRVAGAKVVMYIVGARGEANLWSFSCAGPEQVRLGGGSVEAIKFTRVPSDPNDTQVQVWLDPLRHDLPVRATQKSGPNDEGFELRLLELVSSN